MFCLSRWLYLSLTLQGFIFYFPLFNPYYASVVLCVVWLHLVTGLFISSSLKPGELWLLINNEYSRAADSRGGDFPPFAFINNWGRILNTNFQESFSYCSHIHNINLLLHPHYFSHTWALGHIHWGRFIFCFVGNINLGFGGHTVPRILYLLNNFTMIIIAVIVMPASIVKNRNVPL